eukprot:5409629-Pyramimonas_sp.AAC.1
MRTRRAGGVPAHLRQSQLVLTSTGYRRNPAVPDVAVAIKLFILRARHRSIPSFRKPITRRANSQRHENILAEVEQGYASVP